MTTFMKRLAICVLWAAVAALGLAGFGADAAARDAEICNGAPVKLYLAVSYDGVSRGWYKLEPGGCARFNGVRGRTVNYFAQASEPLARWLSRGGGLEWNGWAYRCVHPREAFQFAARGRCAEKRGFATFRLSGAANRMTLSEENHRGVAFSDLPRLRRALSGRMAFEATLRNTPGREPPFQLGVSTGEGRQGVRVVKVHAGMPAEAEGLKPGDEIVALNGYTVRDAGQLRWVLDTLSLFADAPLPMTILRDGRKISGSIAPMFYEFNHRDYRPGGGAKTFLWSAVNGVAFGFGNELACGGVFSLAEGASALAEERDLDAGWIKSNAERCASNLNRELAKHEILHKSAANAAFWASLIAPGLPVGKLARAARGVPLAARSRFVAR